MMFIAAMLRNRELGVTTELTWPAGKAVFLELSAELSTFIGVRQYLYFWSSVSAVRNAFHFCLLMVKISISHSISLGYNLKPSESNLCTSSFGLFIYIYNVINKITHSDII